MISNFSIQASSILHPTSWIAQILIILICTYLASKFFRKTVNKLQEKFKKTDSSFNYAIAKSIETPASFLILTLCLTFCAEIIYSQYDMAVLSVASSVRSLGVIALISWFFIRAVKELQVAAIKKHRGSASRINRTTIDAISTLSSILISVSALLLGLQTVGFNISGLLAIGGIGGIAIGFAAKDLLSNFFGGLMIYLDRPFEIGDWIKSPDKEIEGTVVKIGWRQTQILTFSHRPLYIPNSLFSTIVLENPSRMTNRRIDETVGVRYDDINNVGKIVKEVRQMLADDDEIDDNKTIIVNVNKFSASSVDFLLYAATKTTNWEYFHEVKQNILLKTAKIIAQNNSEIAFPTSTIHFANQEELRFSETKSEKKPAN